jgi:hypothetical protein
MREGKDVTIVSYSIGVGWRWKPPKRWPPRASMPR